MGTRGGLGRIGAMVVVLAAGLVLALAGSARGQSVPLPIGIGVVGGDEWRASNDFEVFWTNPYDAQVVGASWRAVGESAIGAASFVPGAGISRIEHVHVPYAGLWIVSVWLREASGWESEALPGLVTLRLDDAPPTVTFMSGDAQALPPQLVAAVADPLSGVADGTISYRRLDEQRWADLPTQIRAGALGTELAAATPELKPGTAYVFQAEARDAAGNFGTTTMRADGAPMSFPAPSAGGAGGAGGGRGGGRGGRPGRGGSSGDGDARPTRLEVGLGARGSGSGRTRLEVDAGEAVVLRGRLSVGGDGDAGDRAGADDRADARDRAGAGGRADARDWAGAGERGDALAGRRVRVVSHPARGARGGVTVEVLTSDAGGRFELRLPAGPSRWLTVAFAGEEGLAAVRRQASLRVRGAVSLEARSRRLRTGETLRLGGRVDARGVRIPRAGKLVTISYWETASRRWRPVIVTRTDRAGRFRAEYRFRYVTGRARIRLRATAPAEAEWPYAPGDSAPLTVEVRG